MQVYRRERTVILINFIRTILTSAFNVREADTHRDRQSSHSASSQADD